MSLSQAKKGNNLVIQDIFGEGTARQRLIDLGILKGARLKVKGFAPLGDPMIIEVNDCEIAIRKNDAKNILVN